MKFCPNCGTQCEDDASFCPNCGNRVDSPANSGAGEQNNGQYQQQNGPQYPPQNGYAPVPPQIAPRNLAVCVILSIVTCGIYSIYWLVKLNDEINYISGEPKPTSGIVVWLLGIVTCGIYYLYWYYRMGEKCDRIKGASGGSSNILYLVLGIFGLGIVNYCLMQDTVNNAVQQR